jgi:HAD superfamily hydrolase (TIGR01549 family)
MFDLWNTLIRVPKSHNPYPRIVRLLGLSEEAEFRNQMRSRWMTHSEMSPESFFHEFCNHRKIDANEAMLQHYLQIWIEYLEAIELVEGAKEILEVLRHKGLKTVIVTNTVQKSIDAVKKMEIAGLVNEIVSSADTGFLKPDPRIIQAALSKVSSRPSESVVVGDKLRTDILGGLIVGTKSVLLDPRVPNVILNDRIPIDAIIPRLTDLEEVIEKI